MVYTFTWCCYGYMHMLLLIFGGYDMTDTFFTSSFRMELLRITPMWVEVWCSNISMLLLYFTTVLTVHVDVTTTFSQKTMNSTRGLLHVPLIVKKLFPHVWLRTQTLWNVLLLASQNKCTTFYTVVQFNVNSVHNTKYIEDLRIPQSMAMCSLQLVSVV